MIRVFWVKNYLSIRDKQEIIFVAKGPASELVTEVAEGVFLYKLGILYGSNASGKSNMLIALNEVYRLLTLPKSDANLHIRRFMPFALKKDVPTEMHVSFYAHGVRYDYDAKFNDRHVLAETLNYYPNNSRALFYERTFVGENVQAEIKFGSTLKLQQDLINENRGVVWFVEKNRDSASSEYNRGDSFGLHKNLSLYNSYRIGRLGAKPELGSIFVNLED